MFIIVLDYVLNETEKGYAEETNSRGFTTKLSNGSRSPAKALFDLALADDIALLEGNLERAQTQLTILAKWAKRVGLEVNIKKTEAFSNINHNSPNDPIDSHRFIELEGQRLEWSKNFKHLGSHIASTESDVRIRKGQA